MWVSTGKVVGGFLGLLGLLYEETLFLRAVIRRPAGGLTGRRLGWRKSKKQWCRVKKKAFRKEVLEVVRVGKS